VFHGMTHEAHVSVPAAAIVHLHDRDWVYTPVEGGRFRRVEVVSGNMLPDSRQEIVSGIRPGEQVVAIALVLDNAVEQ
jgi:cobalt-zinc-cadmium efflux system membrane fusion protein